MRMRGTVAILATASLAAAAPTWAARPHHPRHAATRIEPRGSAMRLQAIAYDSRTDADSDFTFSPPAIAADQLPLSAAGRFGGRGVASIGYQSASRPSVGVHEINAAFSSQPVAMGGLAGGNVSIHF